MILVNESNKNQLREIGRQLADYTFPRVRDGGIVLPSESAILPKNLGKEMQNARAGQKAARASEAQGAFGRRQGSSARSGASGATASVVDADGGSAYAEALSEVAEAYPGMRVWEQEGGFWLYTESGLLPGLNRPVSFLTGVSTGKRVVKGWAYKCSAVGVEWIGPRHTNFPDGSICAYDLNDQTWTYGESLVKLLDIYTVWALRHLHYEIFGWWPGPQSVPWVYERILELKDEELCGCGHTGKRYIDCCKKSDMNSNLIREALGFAEFTKRSVRNPPEQISQFMLYRNQLPLISNFIA